MTNINWTTTSDEAALITEIVDRAVDMFKRSGVEIDRLSLEMDLTACHLNGCPLRLDELKDASTFDFLHDIRGIAIHIDRATGELGDCFVPRYAHPQEWDGGFGDDMPEPVKALLA